MKNPYFILVLLSLLAISSIAVVGCTSKPLPPVFEGAHLYNDHHFSSTPAYRCITPSYQEHAYDEGWPFEVNLNTDLPDAPARLTVYKIIRPVIDEDYARSIAKRLGYNDNLIETQDNSSYPGNGYRFLKGTKALLIYEDGTISINDTDSSLAEPYSLPTDQECIDIARGWLESYDLYPENVIDVEASPSIVAVIQGYESNVYTWAISVTFKIGIDGYELYGMGANVVVGEGGEIAKVMVKAPEFEEYSTVSIQKSEVALSNFRGYLNNPQKFWADTPECLIDDLSPKMSIDSASLMYFCMLNEENTQPTYAQPIYVFEGQGYKEDGSEAYSFTGRVDAVSR